MPIKSWLVVALALGLMVSYSGGPSFAQDPAENAKFAVKSMAEELVECAAYFDIVSLALLNSNQAALSDKYVSLRKLAVGRANSLKPGIINERYNLRIKEMTKDVMLSNIPKNIADDLSNVMITETSVLRDKYGNSCKEVMESPGTRATYWMHQADGSSQ